jgi:chromosome segregation ATPase
MATGVPETDVFAAADAVLARGERPTVERVRLELGRGSPARVGQLLEQWWEKLAQRLKGHALLPDLPGEVAQSFAEVWRLALMLSEATARATLAEEHNALFAAQTNLTQERKLWEIALSEAQAQVAESTAQRTQAEAQLQERQALIGQLEAQRTDLLQQRDRLQAQFEQHGADLDILRTEREATQAHVRAMEDRAHQQVDRARQELKVLQQQLEREQREHVKRIADLTAQQEELHVATRTAEQVTAHQAGQIKALETALNQLRSPQRPLPPRATNKSSSPKKKSPRNQVAKKATTKRR